MRRHMLGVLVSKVMRSCKVFVRLWVRPYICDDFHARVFALARWVYAGADEFQAQVVTTFGLRMHLFQLGGEGHADILSEFVFFSTWRALSIVTEPSLRWLRQSSGLLWMCSLLGVVGNEVVARLVAYPFDTIRRRVMMRADRPPSQRYDDSIDCLCQIIAHLGRYG